MSVWAQLGSGLYVPVMVVVCWRTMTRWAVLTLQQWQKMREWISWFMKANLLIPGKCMDEYFNPLKTIADCLGYRKLCAGWVPWMLVPDCREQKLGFRHSSTAVWDHGEQFPDTIVTRDETGYTATNQSQNGSLWSDNTRIHRQRTNSRLSHMLEKSCVASF
jgi:hypothetical protein